ncbi:MAG: hypothetical protein ABI874_01180, partial [Chloroflexota bacterium]
MTQLSIFFSCLALLVLWLALADYAPLNLHRLLYALPLLNVLRAPSRFVLLGDFALAVLAACGAQRMLMARAPFAVRRGRHIAFTALGAVVLALLADFAVAGWIGANRDATIRWFDEVYSALPNSGLLLPSERLFDFLQWAVWLGNPRFAFAAVLLLASALWVAGASTGRLSLRTRQLLALALVSIDLSSFAATYWQAAPTTHLLQPDMTTAWLQQRGDDARVFSWPQSATIPNRLLRARVPEVSGYSSLELKRQSQLTDAIGAYNNRLLDLANAEWIVLPPVTKPLTPTESYDPRAPLVNLAAASPVLQRTFVVPTQTVTRVRVVSALEHAPLIPQGEVVARVIVGDGQGRETVWPMRAGIETAEWALERDDVRPIARHGLAPVAFSFPASDDFSPSYTRHLYRAELPVSQPVATIRLEVVAPSVHWLVYRLMLDETRVERFQLANFEWVSDTSEARIVRNRAALPRAWFVLRAMVEPNAARLWARVNSPEFDPQGEVWLEEQPAEVARNCEDGLGVEALAHVGTSAKASTPDIALVQLSEEHVRVAAHTACDGYVVLADTWYAGWLARDNGVETKIYRADYAYRAVFVRAGEHTLDFTFEPQSVRVGFVISAVSMAVVACLAA